MHELYAYLAAYLILYILIRYVTVIYMILKLVPQSKNDMDITSEMFKFSQS